MAWTIEYSDTARKQLSKLDRTVTKRIETFLRDRLATSENPKLLGHGLVGNLSGYWRYRVGDYRLVCEIRDHQMTVLLVRIGHRSDVYRY